MNFANKTIIMTVVFLIMYQITSIYLILRYSNNAEFLINNQIVFATSTSLAAVIWSLYAVKRSEKFVDFEDMVVHVYDDLVEFRGKMEVFGSFADLIKDLGLDDMISKHREPKEIDELASKYMGNCEDPIIEDEPD